MVSITHAPARIGVYPYESPLNGVDSDSDAVERAVNDIITEDRTSCRIQWDDAMVLTRPLPALDRVFFEGDSMLSAVVLKKFTGGALFSFGGRAGYSGGGLLNFSVPMTDCTAGGYTILGRARADGYAPDTLRLESLYLGAGSNPAWLPWRHIDLIGSARKSPLGIRQPTIRDVTMFAARGGCFYLDTLVQARIDNLSAFPAPGDPTNTPASYIVNCQVTVGSALNVQTGLVTSNNLSCSFTRADGTAI